MEILIGAGDLPLLMLGVAGVCATITASTLFPCQDICRHSFRALGCVAVVTAVYFLLGGAI